MATGTARTERIELRAQPARARRIRQAARLEGKTLSAFMLDAATESAEAVLASSSSTVVPAKFFDELWAALDERPRPNSALSRRASSRRRVVQR